MLPQTPPRIPLQSRWDIAAGCKKFPVGCAGAAPMVTPWSSSTSGLALGLTSLVGRPCSPSHASCIEAGLAVTEPVVPLVPLEPVVLLALPTTGPVPVLGK